MTNLLDETGYGLMVKAFAEVAEEQQRKKMNGIAEKTPVKTYLEWKLGKAIDRKSEVQE